MIKQEVPAAVPPPPLYSSKDPASVAEDVKRNVTNYMQATGDTKYLRWGLAPKELGTEVLCIYEFESEFQWHSDYSKQVQNLAHLIIRDLWIQCNKDGKLQVCVAIDPALEAQRRGDVRNAKRARGDDKN